MHKIRSSLTEHDRPRTSMTSHLVRDGREGSLREFVPFTRERDSMGRLIRPASHQQHAANTKLTRKQTEQREFSPLIHSKIEAKMSKYFKQSKFFDISAELSKNKVVKKKSLINIVFTDPKVTKNDSKPGYQNPRVKSPVKPNKIPFLPNQCSEVKPQTEQGFRRAKSSLLVRSQSSMTRPVRRSEEITFNNREHVTHAHGLTRAHAHKEEELNLQQYQQLNLYHKRQKLQIKMQNTFEEGHLKFIDKMKRSKQLAFDLKCNLDQIDNYC